jgi:hypothetical protein
VRKRLNQVTFVLSAVANLNFPIGKAVFFRALIYGLAAFSKRFNNAVDPFFGRGNASIFAFDTN